MRSTSKPWVVIAAVIWMVVMASVADATTYYVAKSGDGGNDANSCSAAQNLGTPKLTIEAGVACLSSGDTLEIRAGSYAGPGVQPNIPNGTNWENATTIKAYSNEEVTWTVPVAGQTLLQFKNDSQYIILDGIIMDGAGGHHTVQTGLRSHHIRIMNGEIKNAPQQGFLTIEGSEFFELLHVKIHGNGSNDFGHGVYIATSNHLVKGCEIYANGGWGVHVYSGNVYKPHNNLIIGNIIHDNAAIGPRGRGIGLYSGTGNKAINNVVWGNNGGINVGLSADQSRVFNNTVYGNAGAGISVDDPSWNAQVINNISFGNTSAQITNGATDTTLSHNLTTDPDFVDAGELNFQVQATSNAIEAGATLAEVSDDILGVSRPQGDAYDIGAYEFTDEAVDPPNFVWTATDQIDGAWQNSSFTEQTVRTMIRGAAITGSSSHFRLRVRGRTSGTYTITGMRICQRDGETLNCAEGTDRAVTFGGESSVVVQPGTLIQSDVVSLSFADTNDYFVTYYGETLGVWLDSGTVTNSWFADGNQTAHLNWESGITITDTRNWIYAVQHIEAVDADLDIFPTTPAVAPLGTIQFSASGGAEPYVFSVVNDTSGGSINSSTGLYTAGSSQGTAEVRVTDDNAVVTSTLVTIAADLSFSLAVEDVDGDSLTWTIPSQEEIGITHYLIYVHPASENRETPTRWFFVPAMDVLIKKDGTGYFNKIASFPRKAPAELIHIWLQPYYGLTAGERSPRLEYDNSPE